MFSNPVEIQHYHINYAHHCFGSAAVYGQRIDSLKSLLNTHSVPNDTGRAGILCILSDALWKTGHYEEAMNYGEQCLDLTESLNDMNGKAKILNILGIVCWRQDDYGKALEYLDKRGIE